MADLAATAANSLDTPLTPGSITRAGIQALYPYENVLRVVKISGRHSRRFLESVCTRRISDMQNGQCRYSM